MKNSKYIIFKGLFVAGLLFNSCMDLEEDTTKTTLTLDAYYQDEGQAQGGLNGVYSSLRDYFRNHYFLMGTEGTLAIYGNRLQNYNYNSTNQYFINNWRTGYRVIYNANLFLNKVEPIEMDTDLKNSMIAEARFLRGLIYFNLTQFFGGVPIVTEVDEEYEISLKPNGERDNKVAHIEKVYEQIIADLEFAEIHSRPSYYSGEENALSDIEISKATVGAAKSLLAKVYLTMAGWPLNKGASHYQKAKDYAQQVIDSGHYTLLDDYSQLFTPANENNQEVIFNIEYKSLIDQGADWGGWQNAKVLDEGYGRFKLHPSFYSLEENSDALVPTNPHFDATDPRRAYVSVDWDPKKGEAYFNREQPDLNKIETWKFRHVAPPLSYNVTDINCVVLRYADVLMIYAEAENELNGPTQEALDKLNLVRARARKGMPAVTIPGNTPYNPADLTQCPLVIPEAKSISPSNEPADLSSGLTQEELRETIMYDRVKELMMEGWDKHDLIRMGPEAFMKYVKFPKATKTVKAKDRPKIPLFNADCEQTGEKSIKTTIIKANTVNASNKAASAHNMWYPIPQIALDANKNLEQNPGY